MKHQKLYLMANGCTHLYEFCGKSINGSKALSRKQEQERKMKKRDRDIEEDLKEGKKVEIDPDTKVLNNYISSCDMKNLRHNINNLNAEVIGMSKMIQYSIDCMKMMSTKTPKI